MQFEINRLAFTNALMALSTANLMLCYGKSALQATGVSMIIMAGIDLFMPDRGARKTDRVERVVANTSICLTGMFAAMLLGIDPKWTIPALGLASAYVSQVLDLKLSNPDQEPIIIGFPSQTNS